MMPSSSGELIAARTFMGWPQDLCRLGSSSHVFLLSLAQLRFRPLTEALSSSWGSVGPRGGAASVDPPASAPAGARAVAARARVAVDPRLEGDDNGIESRNLRIRPEPVATRATR
jgi:hypothetical protein